MMLRQFVFGVARALILVSVVACSAANCPELAADDSMDGEEDGLSHQIEMLQVLLGELEQELHGDEELDDASRSMLTKVAEAIEKLLVPKGVPIAFTKDLALWSLIVFLIFLFVLKKTAWGPMIEGLDKREAGIRAAIAEAEESRRKSLTTLADYEQKLRGAEQTVAEMVAEAKRDAERTSQDIVAKAQADVESMRDRATEDIGRAKDAALAEVFSTVNSQVALATERVLGRALSDGDQERLIQEALSGISG